MGIGTSIFLIAIGAIVRFALNFNVDEVDLDVIGNILMVVGFVGLVISGLLWLGSREDDSRYEYEEVDNALREPGEGERLEARPVRYRRRRRHL